MMANEATLIVDSPEPRIESVPASLSDEDRLAEAIRRVNAPIHIGPARRRCRLTAQNGLRPVWLHDSDVEAFLPPCPMSALGEPAFRTDHGLRYAYVAGSMATGISSVEMVEALGRAGMLSFFGTGGLPLRNIESAVDRLELSLGRKTPYGFNLLYNPLDPSLETALVDLLIRRGVHTVEASAYTMISLPLVRYRVHGIHRDASGTVITPNRVIAKVSRTETASRFFAPPPERLLAKLVTEGLISEEQAGMAASIPMAQDITAEADSGGHTDNRPALALFPVLADLRDRLQAQYGFDQRLRLGLAGGISTPASAAAAFAMGADYIMTGSVNQACTEAGTSESVRLSLAQARPTDVAMAPSAFLFENGTQVQVLKRGTMFSLRASKLYALFRAHDAVEDIPAKEREMLEKDIFQAPLDEVWEQTRAFFQERDPKQVERAERDARHKMALVFRSYLGQASRWALRGDSARENDYQVWCGPAMGAFNEWVKGSFLEDPANRNVTTVALNILHGAAVTLRLSTLRTQGVTVPESARRIVPLERDDLEEYL
jgi:trans-AT polyketide synthase, acyltransferase and oxidoreductase domains